MTLRRRRATSTTWRHTLAIGLLALLVSIAPRAADVCQAACAHGAMLAVHAAAMAPEHCARHANGRISSHDLGSAHNCGTHGSLIQSAAADIELTRDANLLVALPSSLSFSPTSLTRLPLARFASPPPTSCSRPLTISLRI
jgi:hypothetical protein